MIALFDVPGPRARRHTLVGSLVGGAAVVAVAALVITRLADEGQFRASFWEPFTRPGVLRILGNGLLATLRAAGLSLAIALALGIALASARLSDHRPIRMAATGFVEVFRGLPLLLLVFFAFLGLPSAGIDIGPFGALVLALSIYNGSVLSEIVRAGIGAVPRGQVEAAYAIGLRKAAVFRLVQLPQAVRTMLPTIISQLVVLLKDTSLGFIVAYEELLRSGRLIYTNIGNVIPTAIVVASIYIVINLSLSGLATLIEHRLRQSGAAPARVEVTDLV